MLHEEDGAIHGSTRCFWDLVRFSGELFSSIEGHKSAPKLPPERHVEHRGPFTALQLLFCREVQVVVATALLKATCSYLWYLWGHALRVNPAVLSTAPLVVHAVS